MYRILCCLVLAGLSLSGQTSPDVARLKPAVLKALVSAGPADDAASQELATTMMSLVRGERRPSQKEADGLANALRGALAGRGISDAQTSTLSQCIVDVLRGGGRSNLVLASQVRTVLTTLRIADLKSDLIVRRFVALGEAVRGPDDLPVRDE